MALAPVALAPGLAAAAGFDTPILYTARHQAMGGTAIGYVSDPSAGFHNPAGLQGVRGLSLLGDFSLLLGKVRSTPSEPAGNRESGTVVAPFFLLGAAYRVHEWISIGVAGFPVASGGAEYEYESFRGTPQVDSTEVVFFEVTPLVSLNVPKDRLLPGRLSIGVGHRSSVLLFDRKQGARDDPQLLALDLSGTDFSGFRVGVQYWPTDELKFGLVFRNQITISAEADEGTVAGQRARDVSLPFTLPSRFGGGFRFDRGRFGVALDVEYALQSQNERATLRGTTEAGPQSAVNVYEWKNGVTLRNGFEYRLLDTWPLRAGYVIDSEVTNYRYPGAFGTPPAPTLSLTAGAGYRPGPFEVNVAVARRFGSTNLSRVPPSDCGFCSDAGDYSITMTGLYLDVSTDLPL